MEYLITMEKIHKITYILILIFFLLSITFLNISSSYTLCLFNWRCWNVEILE